MNILLVSATLSECSLLLKEFNFIKINDYFYQTTYGKNDIYLLISGIGLVFTSYALSKVLCKKKYDLIINIGIAGSFNRKLEIGETVQIISDEFADIGIRDKSEFISIFEAGFIDKNDYPFENGILKPDILEYHGLESIKKVKGISVNTVSGNAQEIEILQKKYGADTESMEGAAIFYVCMQENIPVLQIRSISNYVEERDKSKWSIPLAIKNLNSFIDNFIKDLI